MSDSIPLVVFAISLLVIVTIVFIKLPTIKELPEVPKNETGNNFLLKLEKVKFFLFKNYLQKILSKIRVLSLRVDSKTFKWLQKIRKQSQENKIIEKDDKYWEKKEKKKKK